MKIPRWLLRTGQVVLIVAVTYGIVRALAPDLGKLSRADFLAWQPSALMLAISLLWLLAVYLVHCHLWRSITTTLGGVEIGLKSSLRIYFVSSLGRYIPGKLWQIAGMAVLAQKAGISPVAATAASINGQFAFLTSGLVYLALLLPGWGGNAPLVAAALLLGTGVALFVLLTSRARHWLAERVGPRVRAGLDALDRLTWQRALMLWLAYAGTWVLLGVAFVVFTNAFVPLQRADYLHIAGTVAAAYLFGYVAFFSVAGLGIREAVMLGLLSQVMPASAALVVSVASRVWFTAAELLPLALIPITKEQ